MKKVSEKGNSTKGKLATAIISLASAKPIGEVTVQDISNEAGVSRDTFYKYFLDKYDLIDWIYQQHVDKISSMITDIETIKNTVERTSVFLDFFVENKAFIRNVLRDDHQNSFRETFYSGTKEIIVRQIMILTHEDAISTNTMFYIDFNTRGLIGMIEEWVNGEFDLSSKEMARLSINAMPEDLKKWYRGDYRYQ